MAIWTTGLAAGFDSADASATGAPASSFFVTDVALDAGGARVVLAMVVDMASQVELDD
ncbi:MAG: hypothetical protein V4508_10765 [Pseudomonadota bacterium]